LNYLEHPLTAAAKLRRSMYGLTPLRMGRAAAVTRRAVEGRLSWHSRSKSASAFPTNARRARQSQREQILSWAGPHPDSPVLGNVRS